MPFGPGTYFVKLRDGAPALFTAKDADIEDPAEAAFETVGNASLIFAIAETDVSENPLIFAQPLITWKDFAGNSIPEPDGNRHELDGETILRLSVSAPQEPQMFRFTLYFNLGTIGTSEKESIDPTIVEKPAEIPPPPPGNQS